MDELVAFVEDMDEWMAATKNQPVAPVPYTTIPYAPDPRFQLKVPISQPIVDSSPAPHVTSPAQPDNSHSLVDLLMQPMSNTTAMGVDGYNSLLPNGESMEVVEI